MKRSDPMRVLRDEQPRVKEINTMQRIREFARRLAVLLRREQFDRDLQQEMRLHRELKEQELVAAGIPAEQARYAAHRQLGNTLRLQEASRDAWGWRWLDNLAQDLRFAVRILRKTPIITAVAVLTLALGIGANTAIFGVVNAVLLRPLPYTHPDRLVRVWGTNSRSGNLRAWASYPDLQDWRAQNTVFSALGAYDEDEWTWTGGTDPEQVEICGITADYLSVLETQPVLGRTFSPEEFRTGQANVAILSHKFWHDRLASDRGILGRTMTLEDKLYNIVGVMPEANFSFPSPATDVWVPLPVDSPDSGRGSRYLSAIARLRPGVSLAQAQAEMSEITGRLKRLYPESNAVIGVRLEPLQEALVGDSRRLLLILLGVVGFVLVIACVNVANLLFSRLKEREKEIAVRLAVGASRSRVVRQLLTESLLLSFLGGGAGLVLAGWGARTILLASGANIPRLQEMGLDARVLFLTVMISLIPGMLIGLVPALQASRPNLVEELKESPRGAGSPSGRLALRSLLVVAEVAMSLVLLAGAGLLLNSFWRLYSVAPGFDPGNVLTLRISLPESRYPNRERSLALYDNVLDRLRVMPGVESAGIVSMLPVAGGRLCNDVTVENKPLANVDCAEARMVTPDYFRAMRIPLLKGRWFTERDAVSAPHVAVIDETLARLLGASGDAVGRRFSFRDQVREVVGVVGDVRQLGLGRAALPEVYLPLRQEPVPFAAFVVRTASRPNDLAAAAREQIRVVDPDLLIFGVLSMDQVLSESLAAPRFRAILVGGFAALALFLAIIGVASVVAYGATQRTHEFGIRLVLGASRRDILLQVLEQGMRLALLGLVIGLAASAWLTRFLSAMLFAVKPVDIATFASVAVILLSVALCACYVPARRAIAHLDPMRILREE
jgi:predicted permease